LVHVLQSAAHPLLAGASASAAGPLSASFWLASLGAFGVFAVVFAETGLLAGFFLPGDSLLFTAGLFCSARATSVEHLSLGWVLLAAVAGALAGAQTGFTILNPLAGTLDVPTRTFTLWQVTGGILWSAGITLAGYVLGASIPGIDQYLLPVIAVIVIASAIPVTIEILRARRGRSGRHARHRRKAVPEQSW